MPGQVEVTHRTTVSDLLAFGQVQQVHDRASTTFTTELWQAIDLLPIDLAHVRKEQQVRVRAGDEEVFDRIFVLDLGSLQALSTTTLSTIDTGCRSLDVAVVADRNDHRLFFDQVLHVHVADFDRTDLGTARVGMLALDLLHVLFNDVQNVLAITEDAEIVFDFCQQLGVLVLEFFLLEIYELTQSHRQNRIGLDGRERIVFGDTAFFLEDLKAVIAKCTFQHRRRTFEPHQADFGFGLGL